MSYDAQYWTISRVQVGKPYSTKYGQIQGYYIDVTGDTGTAEDNVQLGQKPTTPPPVEGEKLYGYLEANEYGYKFKKLQPPLGGETATASPTTRSEGHTAGNREDFGRGARLGACYNKAVDAWLAGKIEEKDIWVMVEAHNQRLANIEKGLTNPSTPDEPPRKEEDMPQEDIEEIPFD